MAGYMEGYGAGDARRNLWLKRIFGIALPAVLLCVAGYFYFRTWTQERTIDTFVETLQKKDYEAAYRMWCTEDHPCKYYPLERFKEDFGADGAYSDPSKLEFGAVDYCGSGVVFETMYPNAEPFGLWVERSTNLISYAPERRCPGKREINFGGLFKRIFG